MLNAIEYFFAILIIYVFLLFIFKNYNAVTKVLIILPLVVLLNLARATRYVIPYSMKDIYGVVKNYWVRVTTIFFSLLASLIINYILGLTLINMYYNDSTEENFFKKFLVILENLEVENYYAFLICVLIYYLTSFCIYSFIYFILIRTYINLYSINNRIINVLVVDYTVLITLLGVLPFMVDTVFDSISFKEDLKMNLLVFFMSFIVPYLHIFYKSLNIKNN